MDESTAEEPATRAIAVPAARPRRGVALVDFLRRNLTPRLGAALVIWRIEARFDTPIALALVVTFGRWTGALAMGATMAVLSALFLFLLDGEQVMQEMRAWANQRRWLRRYVLPIAQRRHRRGAVQRLLAIPFLVMFTGAFLRAVILLLFGVRRVPAYAITVLGSIPHSLLWTGVVLGGLWEGLVWPFLDAQVF